MKRRTALAMVASGGLFVVGGCDDSAIREQRFLETVKDEAKGIRDAYDTLESQVGEFRTRDWREVVPDVESAMSELQKAIRSLEASLEPPPVD
jgi:hypothetical protein